MNHRRPSKALPGSARPAPRGRGAARLVASLAAAALVTAGCAGGRASERARADLAAGKMIWIPGGLFLLGERTGPNRDVPTYERVRPFLLDATEVTVGEYGRCVAAGRCAAAPTTVRWDAIAASERATWSLYCNGARADRADHPVNCVEWRQAQTYCAWAGKRLPSEAEWEWAARNGPQATPYPWGDAPPAAQLCWNGPESEAGGQRAGTCPIGSHGAGATRAGVQDLAGSVWEWTSSGSVVGADSRGRGGSSGRVARGGGWAEREPWDVTAAVRLPDLPTRRDAQLGFRCASAP